LTILDIGKNQLKEIPHEIGNLTKLEMLYLSCNELINLPPEIGKLTNLNTLDINRNQLTSLPPEIGYLSDNLKFLMFDHNPFQLDYAGLGPTKLLECFKVINELRADLKERMFLNSEFFNVMAACFVEQPFEKNLIWLVNKLLIILNEKDEEEVKESYFKYWGDDNWDEFPGV